jgi:hypothetical protein
MKGYFGMRIRFCLLAGALIGAGGGSAVAQPINLLGPLPAQGTVQSAALPAPRPGSSPPTMPGVTAYDSDAAVPPLEAAKAALGGRRYGLAGQELEVTETRLLNGGAMPNATGITSGGQALAQVRLARDATRQRDRQTAMTAVSIAIAAEERPVTVLTPPVVALAPLTPAEPLAAASLPPPQLPPPPPPPRPVPMTTKAMLPGHWQIGKWQYAWVRPQTSLHPVSSQLPVQGQFVWKDGKGWVWMPSHYVGE